MRNQDSEPDSGPGRLEGGRGGPGLGATIGRPGQPGEIRLLILDALEKRYGEITALDRCSLTVPPGRMVGFLGPNGAGKTTAMRAVFGLVQLDAGRVTWKGRPVSNEDRRRFGYMPEERGLYPRMKVRDQIAYFGRLHGMERAAAAESADRWIERAGLGERAGSRLEDLSHGNQQRAQLSAALVHDSDLLVLDEPFSGLDPFGMEEMAGILRGQTESGAAVLFSSHQLDLVEELCDDVAVIDRGRVVLAGTVRDLKERSSRRRLELDMDMDMDAGKPPDLGIDGIEALESRGTRHTMLVPAGLDFRALLSSLQTRGRIREFSYRPPALSDLFKEAVGR